jgi:hypothetical protein
MHIACIAPTLQGSSPFLFYPGFAALTFDSWQKSVSGVGIRSRHWKRSVLDSDCSPELKGAGETPGAFIGNAL